MSDELPPLIASLIGNASDLFAVLDAVETRLDRFASKEWNAHLGIDWSAVQAGIAEAERAADDFAHKTFEAHLALDTSEALAELAAFIAVADSQVVTITVRVDTSGAAAQMAALQAAAGAGGGGGSALAGLVAGQAAGGGGGGNGGLLAALGFGSAASKGIMGVGAGLAGFGSLGALAGFGPLEALTTVAGIGGSALGALAGGGALALGSLGVGAVGMGTDMAGIGQAITDVKAYNAALNHLNQTIAVYGANSIQAQHAQNLLNYTLAGFPVAAQSAIVALNAAGQQFHQVFNQMTGQAEATGANILTQIVGVAQKFLPTIGKFASENMVIIQAALQPLMQWLQGPGLQIFTQLEQTFQQHLPAAMGAFTQGIELLIKTLGFLAPYTGHFITFLDNLFTKLNSPSGFASFSTQLDHVIGIFHVWEGLVKAIGTAIYELFHHDAGAGTQIIVMLTNMINKFNDWAKTVAGGNQLHTLMEAHLAEIKALLALVPPVLSVFGQIDLIVSPILMHLVTLLLDVVNILVHTPLVGQLLAFALAFEFLGSHIKLLTPLLVAFNDKVKTIAMEGMVFLGAKLTALGGPFASLGGWLTSMGTVSTTAAERTAASMETAAASMGTAAASMEASAATIDAAFGSVGTSAEVMAATVDTSLATMGAGGAAARLGVGGLAGGAAKAATGLLGADGLPIAAGAAGTTGLAVGGITAALPLVLTGVAAYLGYKGITGLMSSNDPQQQQQIQAANATPLPPTLAQMQAQLSKVGNQIDLGLGMTQQNNWGTSTGERGGTPMNLQGFVNQFTSGTMQSNQSAAYGQVLLGSDVPHPDNNIPGQVQQYKNLQAAIGETKNNIDLLSKATGLSQPVVMSLANALGTNLNNALSPSTVAQFTQYIANQGGAAAVTRQQVSAYLQSVSAALILTQAKAEQAMPAISKASADMIAKTQPAFIGLANTISKSGDTAASGYVSAFLANLSPAQMASKSLHDAINSPLLALVGELRSLGMTSAANYVQQFINQGGNANNAGITLSNNIKHPLDDLKTQLAASGNLAAADLIQAFEKHNPEAATKAGLMKDAISGKLGELVKALELIGQDSTAALVKKFMDQQQAASANGAAFGKALTGPIASALAALPGAAAAAAAAVNAAIAGAAAAAARGVAAITNTLNSAGAHFTVPTPSAPASSSSGTKTAGHAAGGFMTAGEMSLVGENGPELFVANYSGAILPIDMNSGGGLNSNALTAGGFGGSGAMGSLQMSALSGAISRLITLLISQGNATTTIITGLGTLGSSLTSLTSIVGTLASAIQTATANIGSSATAVLTDATGATATDAAAAAINPADVSALFAATTNTKTFAAAGGVLGPGQGIHFAQLTPTDYAQMAGPGSPIWQDPSTLLGGGATGLHAPILSVGQAIAPVVPTNKGGDLNTTVLSVNHPIQVNGQTLATIVTQYQLRSGRATGNIFGGFSGTNPTGTATGLNTNAIAR